MKPSQILWSGVMSLLILVLIWYNAENIVEFIQLLGQQSFTDWVVTIAVHHLIGLIVLSWYMFMFDPGRNEFLYCVMLIICIPLFGVPAIIADELPVFNR
jgi:hypothetical protein